MDEFTGEWEGEYKIYALDGGFNRAYPAYRKYEWEKDVQRIESTYIGAGESKHFKGENSIRLGRFYSKVSRRGRPVEEFEGEISKKGLLWKNIHNKNRNYKERVVQTPEGARLETEGFEVFPARGISGLVKVVGVFHRPGVVLLEKNQTADSPVIERRKVGVERGLDQGMSEKLNYLKAEEETTETTRVDFLEDEIRQASAEIKTLKQHLGESKETIQQVLEDKQLLEKELEQITEDRDGLKLSLEDGGVVSQKRLEVLGVKEARIIDLEKEQVEWVASSENLNGQVLSLTDKIGSIQKMNTELAQGKANLEAKLLLVSNEREAVLRKERERENVRLKGMEAIQLSRDEGKIENEALGVKVKSLSVELAELRDQLKVDGKSSDQRVAKMESLEAENQKMSEKLILHKKQEASLKRDLGKREAAKVSYEKKLRQMRDEREIGEQANAKGVTELQSKIKQFEKAAGDSAEEKSGLLNTIVRMKETVAKLEQEKKSFELSGAETAATLAELQSDGASVEEKVREYESKLQVILRGRDLLQKEKDAIEAKFSQGNRERAEAEKKFVALAAQGDALNRAKVVLEGEMHALRKTLSSALSERDGLDQEGKKLEQEVLRLKGALTVVEQAALAGAAQAASLQQKERTTSDDRLKGFSGEKAMLLQKIESMEEQLKSFDQSNAVLVRENQRLAERQKEYERIGSANDSLVNGLRASQAEVESLKAKLADLNGRSPAPVQRRSAPISSGSRKGSPKIKAQVISGARSTPLRPQNEINEVISGFKIIGVNRSPRGDKVILNGKVFRVGEIVDYAKEITFLRLEPDAIIFGGPGGAEYRLKL